MFLKKTFLLLCLTAALLTVETNLRAQQMDYIPPDEPQPQPQAEPLLPKGMQGMKASNIRLDGVLIRGNDRKALVRLRVPKVNLEKKKWESPYRTVREGQDIEGFRVVKIEPKSISVEKGGKSYKILLFVEPDEAGR
jgi:hypothetical protein